MNSKLTPTKLAQHIGHRIVIATYGRNNPEKLPFNIALECEDCSELLADADSPKGVK